LEGNGHPVARARDDLIAQVGNCDNGLACVYQNDLSWRLQQRLSRRRRILVWYLSACFGDGGTASDRSAELRKNRSILDWVTEDMARLQRKVGARRPHKGLTSTSNSISRSRAPYPDAETKGFRGAASPIGASGQCSGELGRPCEVDVPICQVLALQADVTRVNYLPNGS